MTNKEQGFAAGAGRLLRMALSVLLCSPSLAGANAPSLGHGDKIEKQPLQELVRIKRPKGPVTLEIPQALIFGLDSPRSQAYCSPQVRTTNSSNKTVEELIVGIRYRDIENKVVGSTVTRFFLVKMGAQDTHYFYSSLSAKYCGGLTGEVEVMRCVYEDGVDCKLDVQPSPYGAVPLRFNTKKEGE